MKNNNVKPVPSSTLCVISGVMAGCASALFVKQTYYPFAPITFTVYLTLILASLSLVAALLLLIVARRLHISTAVAVPLSILVCLLAAGGYFQTFSGRDTNVILIISDATRADHLHCYGYERKTTPNIDALAEQGTMFRKAIAQGSHTIVATPCIIASIFPSQHGMMTYRDILSDSVVTVAEALRADGFETVGISTNPHLTEATGFDQGFDSYDADRSWLNTEAEHVVDRFINWLDGNGDKKFFAFLFFIDPHSPYEPPTEYLKAFGGDETFAVSDWNLDSLRLFSPDKQKEILARYDGELAYFDHHLGRLIEALEERNLFDRTMMIYTSDHGEAFWEHGNVGHGDSLYEELLRIPLIIKLPVLFSFPALRAEPGVVEEPAAQIDVMPTILDCVHLDVPDQAQGISLIPSMFGHQGRADRLIFSEEILLQLGPYNIKSVRRGPWKFILDQNIPERSVGRELYDLEEDPEELNNLIGEESATAGALERELVVFMGRMERMNLSSGRQNMPTKAMLENLKALGYIQ